MNNKGNRYSVPALEKGLLIIETLARSDVSLGISDIATVCELPKSSVFAILSTLEDRGYIIRDSDGKFRLSMKISDLAMSTLSKLDVRYVAHPVMERLARELGYTVHLATLVRGKAVYIDKVPGPGFIQFSTLIGQSQFLHNSAVGKVIAAYISEQELDQALETHGLPQSTPNTLTTPALYKKFLSTVRELGYAVEDEEGEIGVRCIAAPIFDARGLVVAALGITGVRNELPSTSFTSVGEVLKSSGLDISKELGYGVHCARTVPADQ